MAVDNTVIVDSIEELTPEWFTGVLREDGSIPLDTTVSEVHSELIGAGQVGRVVRCELAFSGSPEGAPTSLVVKLPSAQESNRQISIDMGFYEREVRFYQEIAPRVGMALPRVYWADVEAASGRFTLVIEDLTSSTEGGDMIAGATLRQAELAFAELVELQAPVWNDPRLRSLRWLADPAPAQLMFDAVASAVEPFEAAYGDRLEPEHLELVERLGPKAPRWPAKALVDPLVVVHADYRLDNMLFGTGQGTPPITLLDWQACRLGPPLLDHAIFLGSSMSTEDRRANERPLLRAYHERLLSAGVTGFTWQDCLESYRIGSLYPFLVTVGLSLSLAHSDSDREAWTHVLRSCAELVQDVDAASALD